MLQRAASNAYSWWWASHVRTKQGKWLEQSLQDMEEKVKCILQIIEEDADSFAKRAEMYYKKRPELINFVEESYRAYRALAERYEHISKELHNANKTIASVCPEQVEFEMEDDADEDQVLEQTPKPLSPAPEQLPKPPSPDPDNIPKPVPENPKFNLKANAPRKDPKSALPPKPKKPQSKRVVSQKSKDEAQEKIDKLQKGILVLQTEKEFVKSSYESGLAKYWEIDNQIVETQEEICSLQDEFSVDIDDTVIGDNEARALMTAMALKSCKDTLVQLRERQKRSMGDARVESQRVKDAEKRLKALKDGSLEHWTENGKLSDSTAENSEGDFCVLKQERLELQSICEKIKGYFEMNSNTTTTVTELVEKVDGLVTVVLGLETTVSSQTAVVERLRSEMDELQKHLSSLEEDKDQSGKVKELEEELHGVQDLNQSVEDRNNELRRSFMEACHTFDSLFVKLESPKQKDEERVSLEPTQEGEATIHSVNLMDEIRALEVDGIDVGTNKQHTEEDSPDWQKLFLNGLEDREKVLLTEYKSILRNYKETKIRLSEMEKRSKETLAKVTELNSSNATKDVEIWSLRKKLGLLHTTSLGNPDTHLIESKDSAVNRSKSSDYDANRTYYPNKKILAELLYEQNGKSIARRGYSSTSMLTETPPTEEGTIVATEEQHVLSGIEEKFRRDIDQLLEENLQYWLRFSSSFHQIQKFQTVVQELQSEVSKMRKDSKKQDSSTNASDPPSAEAGQINKRIKELRTELFLWLEQNVLMKEELQCRLSSLGDIQEEITRALKTSSELEQAEFTPYQASKFKGEIRNMQQENNKVSEELQAGLDHVRRLQLEVEKLSKMRGLEPSGSKNSQNRYHHVRYSTSRSKIPLRNFIFGVKPKKLSVVSGENPALQKQSSDTGDGSPT